MAPPSDLANRITTQMSREAAMLATLLLSLAAAPAAEPKAALPPRTITFSREVPRDPTLGLPPPRHGYFTNHFLPPDMPESRNRGAFACSEDGGRATYLQGSASFHRALIYRGPRSSEEGIRYYLFEEAQEGAEKRYWTFEASPNPEGNCAIYYRVGGGTFTLFQVADQAQLATPMK